MKIGRKRIRQMCHEFSGWCTRQERYDKAMGQLKDGRGNMISQAIKLKQLGLKSNKEFPERLMPSLVDEDEKEEDVDFSE